MTYVATASTMGAEGGLMSTIASCDPGDLVTGGGFETTTGEIAASSSVAGASGWSAAALAPDDRTGDLEVLAVCLDLPPKRAGVTDEVAPEAATP